jgi:hypothetical protein
VTTPTVVNELHGFLAPRIGIRLEGEIKERELRETPQRSEIWEMSDVAVVGISLKCPLGRESNGVPTYGNYDALPNPQPK